MTLALTVCSCGEALVAETGLASGTTSTAAESSSTDAGKSTDGGAAESTSTTRDSTTSAADETTDGGTTGGTSAGSTSSGSTSSGSTGTGLPDAEGFRFEFSLGLMGTEAWDVLSAVQTPDGTLELYAGLNHIGGISPVGIDLAMNIDGLTPGTYACDDSTRLVARSYVETKFGLVEQFWASEAPGECSIVLNEVGDMGELVTGTFEATLVNSGDDWGGLGETWTLSNGTFELVRER